MSYGGKNWWNDLSSMWWKGEKKVFPSNPDVRYYYQKKFEAALKCNPTMIAEIGVRAGYSAFSFLSACPRAEFIGIDNDGNEHGGVEGLYTTLAPKILSRFNSNLRIEDTQKLNAFPVDVDFLHIDGDHSYKGCAHDLDISKDHTEWILVDDYDFIKEVREATEEFLRKNPSYEREYIDDHFRGSILIHTDFRRNRI